jgi:hypothetical protein
VSLDALVHGSTQPARAHLRGWRTRAIGLVSAVALVTPAAVLLGGGTAHAAPHGSNIVLVGEACPTLPEDNLYAPGSLYEKANEQYLSENQDGDSTWFDKEFQNN